MQAAARPIKPETLGPLGGTTSRTLSTLRRRPSTTFRYKLLKGVDDGVPWIAEAAFAYRRDGGPGADLRDQLVAGADARSVPTRLSARRGLLRPDEPIVLLVHLICPRPEFLDRGKSQPGASLARLQRDREAVARSPRPGRSSAGEIRDEARERSAREDAGDSPRAELSLKDAVLKHLPTVSSRSAKRAAELHAARPVLRDAPAGPGGSG